MKKSKKLPIECERAITVSALYVRLNSKMNLKYDEVMNFLWEDTNFMNPNYAGSYQRINDYLVKHPIKIYGGPLIEKIVAIEAFSIIHILDAWRRKRQAYEFDAEFEQSLADRKMDKVPVHALDHLQHRTLYINFADDGTFKSKYYGVFLHIVPEQTGYRIFVLFTENNGYSVLGKIDLIPDAGSDGTVLLENINISRPKGIESVKDLQPFVPFIVNALLHICTSNGSNKVKLRKRPLQTIKFVITHMRKGDE